MTLISSISGIRGTVGGKPGKGLTPFDIVKFTTAYGQWIRNRIKKNKYRVVIGRDARPSGRMLNNLVTGTLQALGIDVMDIGISTTPTVELAVCDTGSDGGMILTASHNPGQWNALKLLDSTGEFLDAREGAQILRLAERSDMCFVSTDRLGSYGFSDGYIDSHIDKICALQLVDREAIASAGFRIVVDCVQSSGGIAVPRLLKKLGVRDVVELYCEPDGIFPHNPEPLPEHLTELAEEVIRKKAHLGIAVDPDVDRLALVSDEGEMFGEEYTLVAVADYVLSRNKGNTVSNLSSTRALKLITEEKWGARYHASAVGEVHVVAKMKETNAVIGGEGNGGVIFPELHYGRDALVGIALFLTHLALSGKTASALRATYPDYYISKNKIELDNDLDTKQILDTLSKRYGKYEQVLIDGVRIDFGEEWVHLRRSNTEPVIRIYAEADSHAKAENIAQKLLGDIKEIIRTQNV